MIDHAIIGIRSPRGLVLAMIGCLLLVSIAAVQAQQTSPTSKPVSAKTIADFRSDAVLKKINTNEGVTISRTKENSLEVRVTPFAEHKNQWPVIVFGPDFFGEAINLAEYSRLEIVLHHQSEGMSRVDLNIATAPDGSGEVDEELFMVPGHTTMVGTFPVQMVKNSDPSQIALIRLIFRPRETETIYHIEPIRAVYDPAIGSPAGVLVGNMGSAKEHFDALKQNLSSKLPADQQAAAEPQIAALGQRVEALKQNVNAAKSQHFYKAYRSLSRQVNGVISEIGRLRFLGAGSLWVWEPDRYPNIVRETGPDLQVELLKDVSIKMAGNEFRDFVFSVTASGRDLSLNVAVRPTGDRPLPAQAVQIRQAEFLKNPRGEETGDAVIPVDGLVQVPAGESRQFWVRFDTRTTSLSPGHYTFELVVGDSAELKQVFPGKLEIWDFSLPSYDILPNNSYAIFLGGSKLGAGEGFRKAVQHMKLYGLNYVYIEPPELPRPKGIDDHWQITGYDDEAFRNRVTGALDAWKGSPGDERINFILSLSTFEELGLKREGYAFPNAQWKQVFAQWLDHLKSVIAKTGLKKDQWMLVLRDESGEPALMQFEIPLAEAIKSLDPSIRITCNTSTMLNDPQWSERLFKAFDVFQPHLGRDLVLQWLKTSGKELWVYKCDTGKTVLERDLYDYYRIYAWDMLDKGFVGTGLWTYYSSPHDRPWGEDVQGCQLIYMHPEHGLVHSRRYEMFREGMDDFRYVAALRSAAKAKGPGTAQTAELLIQNAVKDITTNRQDRQRCETWRIRIAEQIVAMQ